jgi:hypothetical protein
LGTFKREKQKKNAKATLPCVFWKAHGKVTKTNNRNSAFAVRLSGRTTMVPLISTIAVRFSRWRTAKNSGCRAFWSTAHG